ncbi:MAG: 2,3-bisphosphoglycerate-independent phosphoglycerate mutase [Candidatus Peribacteria bacterium]|nr:2,3-bisphosphoglycerate-independent phosphoglycerate mutase [Candidatus Peribacteria bacterium]
MLLEHQFIYYCLCMSTLILLRHGQSAWNLENRFTGWTDVPLTPQGEKDAVTAGEHLKDFHFDIAFTSRLKRANQTLDRVLESAGQTGLPTEKDSALNERHYGDLQGLNKAETAEKYGQEQVRLWRRSYETRPPNGESMEDCERRTLPFFLQYILPEVNAGKTVLVAAHGNSLRPIMKYLEKLSPEDAASMEIGLCTPYIYTFEDNKMTHKEIREIPGIVTKVSITEKSVQKGTV